MKKFKRAIASLLCAVMILGSAPLGALIGFDFSGLFEIKAEAAEYSGICGDNLFWKLNTQTEELSIYGTGDMTDWSTMSDVPWYELRSEISSVTISGATSIGNNAFAGCYLIESITIPDSVTRMGQLGLKGSEYYDNEGNWENGALYIGKNLINTKDSISSKYTVKDGTRVIAGGAFLGNKTITEVNMPDSVLSIGLRAFDLCSNLTSVTLSESIDRIELGTFSNCDKLTSIVIPKKVKSIDRQAFYFSGLTEAYYPGTYDELLIEDANEELEISLIYESDSDRPYYTGPRENSVSWKLHTDGELIISGTGAMPDYKTYGPWYAHRSVVKTVNISDGITSIGKNAFRYCENLTSATIPKTVTNISNDAFHEGVDSLTDVYYAGSEKEWKEIDIGLFNSALSRATIHYNTDCEHNYASSVTKQPTCKEAGIRTFTCSECKDSYIEEIAKKAHTTSNWVVSTPATCTENGTKVKKCVDCGEIQQSEPIIATGHIPGEWVIIKPATTTTTGIKAQRCANCSEILISEDTPVLTEKVHGVSVSGGSIDYKSTIKIAPIINADEGVGYTVTYSSSNPDAVVIDENGNVIAKGVGVAEITVTVTDEKGNVVTDTCEIEVRYNWWQWIIRILLLGFLWY